MACFDALAEDSCRNHIVGGGLYPMNAFVYTDGTEYFYYSLLSIV